MKSWKPVVLVAIVCVTLLIAIAMVIAPGESPLEVLGIGLSDKAVESIAAAITIIAFLVLF